VVPDLHEHFDAITVRRHFEPPPGREPLGRTGEDVLRALPARPGKPAASV
jgi:hypothetical protein